MSEPLQAWTEYTRAMNKAGSFIINVMVSIFRSILARLAANRPLAARRREIMPLPDKKRKATDDLVTFKITCRVSRKDWEGTKRLGFKDNDLPGMVEGMIHDLGGQGSGR